MFFLSPLALLGLGAALVPPFLHLMKRRLPPEVVFPAVRYLRQTEREAERAIRLRHVLLMALRMLAVALVALAAARPVVPRSMGALHEPTALALVLDHSLSAGAIVGGARLFDDLATRARETLRAAQPGDALWLIGADGLPRRGAPAELLEAVAALGPEARRLDLAASVGTAARVIATAGYARGEIHVLTDLQATAFGPRDARGDSAAAGLPVVFYHPAVEPPENLAVVEARAQPGMWLAGSGGGGGGGVAVRIGGAPARSGARVSAALTVGGRAGGRALVSPGDEVVLAAPAADPGWRGGEVTLDADELRADDHRPLAVRVVAPAAVKVDPRADLGRFAGEALAALGAAGHIRLGVAGGVWLGHAPPGGPAVVFPPADTVQLGAVNRALAAFGVGWRFGARVEREDTVLAPEIPELSGARVGRRYRLEPAGDGAESARAVLARAGRDPWVVRDGQVVLLASRMVPEETALPLTGAFVPFMGALVNRIARGEAGLIEAAPGDPVSLPGRVTAVALAPDSAWTVPGGAVVPAPETPGLYALLSGPDTIGMLVVAPDARESNLTRAAADRLRAAFPGARVTVTSNPREYATLRFRGSGRSELTGGLLAVALALLLAEAALAAGGPRRRG